MRRTGVAVSWLLVQLCMLLLGCQGFLLSLGTSVSVQRSAAVVRALAAHTSPQSPQYRVASAPFQSYWTALKKANVTQDRLQLPDDVFFLGQPSLRNMLYVRPCYRQLRDKIRHWWAAVTQHVFVIGVPGE